MISANTLFHFTNSIENLQNILTNNFSPRYCLEYFDYVDKFEEYLALPMVCFCDIPLSQTTEHIDKYGSYAIGLKKEWAIQNAITPVLYLHNESQTRKIINSASNKLLKLDKLETVIKRHVSARGTMDAFGLFFFCKKYKGNMWRNGKLKKDITFYNEREWRYIPDSDVLLKINPGLFISKKEYDDFDKRKSHNESLSFIKINFTPNDIKYVIIKKESERLKITKMINKIKGSLYSTDELKVLSSKIISVEQIKEDF